LIASCIFSWRAVGVLAAGAVQGDTGRVGASAAVQGDGAGAGQATGVEGIGGVDARHADVGVVGVLDRGAASAGGRGPPQLWHCPRAGQFVSPHRQTHVREPCQADAAGAAEACSFARRARSRAIWPNGVRGERGDLLLCCETTLFSLFSSSELVTAGESVPCTAVLAPTLMLRLKSA